VGSSHFIRGSQAATISGIHLLELLQLSFGAFGFEGADDGDEDDGGDDEGDCLEGGGLGFVRQVEEGGGAAGGGEEGKDAGGDDAMPFPLGTAGGESANDVAAAEREGPLEEGGVADQGIGGEAEG